MGIQYLRQGEGRSACGSAHTYYSQSKAFRHGSKCGGPYELAIETSFHPKAEILQHLEEMLLVANNDAPILDPEFYVPYFHLAEPKRVFQFRVGRYGNIEFDVEKLVQNNLVHLSSVREWRTSGHYTMSSVEHLGFRNAYIRFEELCELISLCRALRTFCYEHSWRSFLYQYLMSALVLHAGSLRNLSLDHTDGVSLNSAVQSTTFCFEQLTRL